MSVGRFAAVLISSRVHACPGLVVELVVDGSSFAHRVETLSRHTVRWREGLGSQYQSIHFVELCGNINNKTLNTITIGKSKT